MGIRYLVMFIFFFFPAILQAEEPFVIQDIQINGLQRTEPGTVFSYLPIKVGDMMDDDKAEAAIKALYATGFFKNVRLESENGILLIVLTERPTIAEITITGAKEFESGKLKSSIQQSGLAMSRTFDRVVLDKAETELKQQYLSRGRYSIKITSTVTPLERNRVAINFSIDEGEVARIRKINLIGINAFKEKELTDLFALKPPNLISWFTKNDQYSKQKLSADLETLRSYYLDNGYLEFNIDSTQVSVTPDMREIYITVNISEGAQYKVSEVTQSGKTDMPEADLKKLILIKSGDVFSRKKLTESVKMITDGLGESGYAFASVNATPELNKEKQEVSFHFSIDPGLRVYVRRVVIEGNIRTRDSVIRREIRQLEGGWYSTAKINRSKQRIDRTNYFTAVNLETPAVEGSNDKVDIKFKVTEKPTGNVMFGVGYSQQEGIMLNGNIQQENLFGTGKILALTAATGAVNKVYSLSFTDPYFTLDGITAGGDIYYRALNTKNLNAVANINTTTYGVGIRSGLPINEKDIITVGLGAEMTEQHLSALSPTRAREFVRVFGVQTSALPASIRFSRDGRDSAIWTTSGTTQRVFVEVGLPGADLNYYKVNLESKYWQPITDNFTLLLRGEASYGNGYDGRPLPYFKNFFAGGNTSVRGYMISSLGPRDDANRALGGNRRLVGSTELLFPMPGMKSDRTLRVSGFLDAGGVWGPGGIYPQSEGMRYSTGVAVSWVSPMGPLKVSLGYPLNKQPGDYMQPFQFEFGQQF